MCMGGRLHGCWNCPIGVPVPVDPPGPVPLTGAAAEVTIIDFTAQVVIKQRYENREKNPIEGVYDFPLDAKASVYEFWAEIDGKKVVGTIKEKQKAIETYEDAIASGHGAYLLEQKKENLFTASVGNLPPDKEVLICIGYVTELKFDDGKLNFVIPSLPYAPDGKTTPKFSRPTLEKSEFADQVGYGLKINVKFEMTSNIKSISSPSHPIKFEFGDSLQQANVSLSNDDGTPLVNDFVLQVALAKPHEACVRLQADKDQTLAMVALYPNMDDYDYVKNEIIFVLDRSGSMDLSSGGTTRINQVRETMQIFLRCIPEGTKFNIIGFGSSIQMLFKQSTVYDQTSLETASKHIASMKADLGGTEIKEPLLKIFASKTEKGVPRQVFVMTDGDVSNKKECIEVVKKNAETTRVFTFGIGEQASVELVEGMAKAGSGYHEIIKSGSDMTAQVMRQVNRALKPALTNVKLDWGKLKVKQTPFVLPPIFEGNRLIVYGFLPEKFESGKVTLKADTSEGPFSCSVEINSKNIMGGNSIVKLAAKSLITDLEEDKSYHKNAYQKSEVDKEIIQLSITNGVLSSKTAFVAVEKRTDGTFEEMKLRKVNEMKPQSQAQTRSRLHSGPGSVVQSNSMAYGAMPPPAPRSFAGPPGGPVLASSSFSGGGGPPLQRRSSAAAPPPPGRGGAPSFSKMSAPKNMAPPPAPSKDMFKMKESSSLSEKRKKSKKMDSSMDRMQRSSSIEKEESLSIEQDDEEAEEEMESNAFLDDLSIPPPPQSAPQRAEEGRAPSFDGALLQSKKQSAPVMEMERLSVSVPEARTTTEMSDLLKSQMANGSFPFSSLAKFVKLSQDELKAKITLDKVTPEILAIFITAIAVAVFQNRFADQKDTWSLAVKKAENWIKKESQKLSADGFDFKAAASQVV
eukprot:TRINITY_DN2208_c0_g1_i1.p1 TRINITY_DN2208_c0_g1~~TRINITY_DN2208_c0_g1_i1.p1  ORF type:complete len:913 (-),score=285.21 TRINITY_DN2208_c0_g1_i1:11-2749(-)